MSQSINYYILIIKCGCVYTAGNNINLLPVKQDTEAGYQIKNEGTKTMILPVKISAWQVNIFLPAFRNMVLIRSSPAGLDFLNINRRD